MILPADPGTFTAGGKGGPKILWVTLDTVSAEHLAPWGGRVPLPTLEALGAVRVKQAFSNFPETALSHWSMFTGVLPEVHGNVAAAGSSRYAGPSVAELARARGYATAAFIGGLTLRNDACGLGRGFDVYNDTMIPEHGVQADAPTVIEAANTWIAAQPGPWFAFVHLFDAHVPYLPANPVRFDRDYAGAMDGREATLAPYRDAGRAMAPRDLNHVEALYDSDLAQLDDELASLFGPLKGDEIIIVTADHGESFAHEYLFNHRAVLWDDVLHVPLYVKAPGLKPQAVDGMLSLLDLAPTVVDLAGWGATAPFQGVSRVNLLNGRGGGAASFLARTDPWVPLLPGEPGARLAERTPTAKRIREVDGRICTYDLVADPNELNGACAVGLPADDDMWAAYNASIASMAKLQRAEKRGEPTQRFTPTEMLEKLGYVDPARRTN
ncbi:hypothetical protein LBMAG42_32110 [Deltaproteobacteria bacterium]|nr:hypothetical protein LBMAG42_32110 [Deltaproteobacteria bacterium]